jgi:hypothetical protein
MYNEDAGIREKEKIMEQKRSLGGYLVRNSAMCTVNPIFYGFIYLRGKNMDYFTMLLVA